MLFPDDAVLVSHSYAGLGLTISLQRTKTLAQGTDTAPDITIDNTHLELMDPPMPALSLSLDTKMSSRTGKAAAAMSKLNKHVWSNIQMTVNTKLRVYQACVLSTLLYGIESGLYMLARKGGSTASTYAGCPRRLPPGVKVNLIQIP